MRGLGGESPQAAFSSHLRSSSQNFLLTPAHGLLEVTRGLLSILGQPRVGRLGWRAEPSVA